MRSSQGHTTTAPRLTSHLRALSLIAPIQKLEDTEGLLHTQGQAAEHVDLRYLALATIDLLIERMGAGGTTSCGVPAKGRTVTKRCAGTVLGSEVFIWKRPPSY